MVAATQVQTPPSADTNAPLTIGDKLRNGYGIGQLAEGVTNESFAIFLLFFYREVQGLPGALAGLSLLISLCIDAITDPLVGKLSDRTRTRWGRRHPYMLAAALPWALSYYLAFAPPDGLSHQALFLWLTVTASAARLAMTFFFVPHMALGAELSSDYQERTRIVSTRMFYSRLGGATPGLLGFLWFMRPTASYDNGQLNPGAYPGYALATAILVALPVLISVVATRHTIPYLQSQLGARERGGGLWSALIADAKACARLHNFRVHFFGGLVAYTAWGIVGTLTLHLATYFWRIDTPLLVVWGFCLFLGVFVGLFFWSALSPRFEKRSLFVFGLGIFIAFTAPPILCKVFGLWPARESPLYLPLFLGTTGFAAHFGIAATMVTGGSMMADVSDEDELEHGSRRQGVFFGALAFASKAAVGLGAQIGGVLVDQAHLIPGSDPETVAAEVPNTLALWTGLAVAVLATTSMFLFSRYDLTRSRHRAIADALSARAAGRPQEPA